MVRKPLFAAVALFAFFASARAQDMMIDLKPEEINSLPCSVLLAGFDVKGDDLKTAVSNAAASGYRLGYVMGYLHGALDVPGKKGPLTEDELNSFIDTYNLLCKQDGQLSIYEAARDAMKFHTR